MNYYVEINLNFPLYNFKIQGVFWYLNCWRSRFGWLRLRINACPILWKSAQPNRKVWDWREVQIASILWRTIHRSFRCLSILEKLWEKTLFNEMRGSEWLIFYWIKCKCNLSHNSLIHGKRWRRFHKFDFLIEKRETYAGRFCNELFCWSKRLLLKSTNQRWAVKQVLNSSYLEIVSKKHWRITISEHEVLLWLSKQRLGLH